VFNFVKQPMSLGIFISELHAPEDAAVLRDYLADLVIRLGYRSRRSHFRERILEIEKCRTQSHIRGEHMFSIQSGKGIAVYISTQSLLSVWRRRVRKERSFEEEHWDLGPELNLDPILKGDLVRGSANLLAGPPATHKFPLGLSFLASGLRPDSDTHVLLISLREDEASILNIVKTYPQLCDLLNGDSSSFNSRLKILYVPPDYYTAERLIHWIREVLREYKRKKKKFSRVLFSSLSQLSSSPMFEEEHLYVAALIEYFRKEEITSLFIDTGGERGAEINTIVDTIITTKYDDRDLRGDRVIFTVGHSGPCNADRRPKYLDRVTENGFGRLVLRDKEPS